MTTIEFSNEFQKLQRLLLAFANRLTRNSEDAKDLLQETAVRAYGNRDKFKINTNFKAWVTTIMRNTFINDYRRKKTRNLYTEPIENHLFGLESKIIQNAAEERLARQELGTIINELDDTFSRPFNMHFQGYKYEEIASELNVPIGTVKSRIFFARKKLKREIKNQYKVH